MKSFLSLLAFLIITNPVFSAQPPNILVIIADDCTFSDLPLDTPKAHRAAAKLTPLFPSHP